MVEKINKLIQQSGKNIVLYFDEDGSFKENLSSIESSGIKVVEVKDNYFALKYYLEMEWHQEKLFLYHPFKKPDNKQIFHYPLLDILLANSELRTDDASEFLSQFNLNKKYADLVSKYIHILKTKTNQKKLAKILHPDEFNQDKLELGIISIVLDFYSVASKNDCLAKLLHLTTDTNQLNKALKQLIDLDLDTKMVAWFNALLQNNIEALNENNLIEIAENLKYNIITALLKPQKTDPYLHLKTNNTAILNRVEAFFEDWQQHPNLNKFIEPILSEVASKIKIDTIISVYGIDAEYGYYTSNMYSLLLKSLYSSIYENPYKVKDETIKWVRKLNIEQSLQSQLWFLYYTANFIEVLSCYNSFKFNSANQFINEYTTELYKVDFNYRKAVIEYTKVRDSLNDFEELANSTFKSLNEKYDRFLIELNVEWQTMLQEIDFQYNKIETDKQFNFYRNHIEGRDYKIAVIISDAFRYELGHELYLELMSESKNNVELSASLASIPSYTNLGMSNLLPNNGIALEKKDNDLSFKINDITTVSTNRENILKLKEPKSATINYTELVKYDRDQGRDFFKNNRVVYIYHDWIDAIGDKKGTEHQTFEATSKAANEIKDLISKIYGWNITHVLVTSDHGFLFNYNTLTESSRENLPTTKGYTKEHTRFVVSDEFDKKIEGYKFDLKNTTNIDTDLKVAVPRAINRYRKQGNIGVQFVHGGASLQEMLTPVITYYKQKNKVVEIVPFRRIDNNTKINSNSLKVILLQDESVSNNYKAADLVLGIYSASGELLSNEVSITLNATSTNPKERIFECILSLNQAGAKASFGYLKAFEIDDKLNPVSINDIVTINSLMGKDEF